jgi:hypothetical protein
MSSGCLISRPLCRGRRNIGDMLAGISLLSVIAETRYVKLEQETRGSYKYLQILSTFLNFCLRSSAIVLL